MFCEFVCEACVHYVNFGWHLATYVCMKWPLCGYVIVSIETEIGYAYWTKRNSQPIANLLNVHSNSKSSWTLFKMIISKNEQNKMIKLKNKLSLSFIYLYWKRDIAFNSNKLLSEYRLNFDCGNWNHFRSLSWLIPEAKKNINIFNYIVLHQYWLGCCPHWSSFRGTNAISENYTYCLYAKTDLWHIETHRASNKPNAKMEDGTDLKYLLVSWSTCINCRLWFC